jgi:TatD DNase family protein
MGLEEWSVCRELFGSRPDFFFILGIHPTEAPRLTEKELSGLRLLLRDDKRIRAVGEIGLDYHWKNVPPAEQHSVFRQQIRLAREYARPLVIHCRDALEDAFPILLEEGCRHYPLLWHCFGGDTDMALRLLDQGWHISVPGSFTYPSNSALREAVKHIPAERLMLETDCPYLAPLPHRGARNEPAYLAFTVQAVAEARGVDRASLWTSCGETAGKFFALEPLSPTDPAAAA